MRPTEASLKKAAEINAGEYLHTVGQFDVYENGLVGRDGTINLISHRYGVPGEWKSVSAGLPDEKLSGKWFWIQDPHTLRILAPAQYMAGTGFLGDGGQIYTKDDYAIIFYSIPIQEPPVVNDRQVMGLD